MSQFSIECYTSSVDPRAKQYLLLQNGLELVRANSETEIRRVARSYTEVVLRVIYR
jgi:hypothetical protein